MWVWYPHGHLCNHTIAFTFPSKSFQNNFFSSHLISSHLKAGIALVENTGRGGASGLSRDCAEVGWYEFCQQTHYNPVHRQCLFWINSYGISYQYPIVPLPPHTHMQRNFDIFPHFQAGAHDSLVENCSASHTQEVRVCSDSMALVRSVKGGVEREFDFYADGSMGNLVMRKTETETERGDL